MVTDVAPTRPPSAPNNPGVRFACSHCGLDVPAGLVRDDVAEQFCCAGCETVWNVLHGAGLEGYYAVRDAAEADPTRPSTSGGTFEEFADPAYQRAFVRPLPGGLCETEFLLEGVHCAACVWLLERLPRVTPGATEARVGLRTGIISVRYRPDEVQLPTIARQLDRLGYRPHPARGQAARDARARDDRAFLVRVAVAGACAGNIMLLAIALYSGAISGIDPFWESLFRWLSMGIGLVSLAWPGRIFFRGALGALRTRTAHLDLPIAIALLAGGAWGAFNTVRGQGEIYFDSLSVLVFLLLVGRWVQHRQQRAAVDSIELMLSMTPSAATVVGADGQSRRVPIDAVEVGDLVEVRAGDTIPADGTVEEGDSSVDESLLTGESLPREVGVGDDAVAGATNIGAPLLVRVGAVGTATRVGRLMAQVADASARRAPVVRLADRIAGWFVIAVVSLAMVTFAIWAPFGVREAMDHATALLIVACPCALGLATPLAMGVGVGRSARGGALVKDAAALQILASPGVMLLDKTGTITRGEPALLAWHADPELLAQLGALEQGSSHPIAMALSEHAGDSLDVTDRVHVPGSGVTGRVGGVTMTAGTASYLESCAVTIDDERRALALAAASAGRTPVLVAIGRRCVGVAELGDDIRDDSAAAIQALRDEGWELRVLSGDRQGVVNRVCETLGLEGAGVGEATPEEKARVVRELIERGRRVVMVGDGVNDAAAMAGASVGIAVHGGAEASLQAADVYLTHHGLTPISELTARSRATMRTVRTCLTLALCYNFAAAALAMGGVMTALLAALLMPASSLTAVAIALHAGRVRGEP